MAITPHQHLLARGRGLHPGSVAALQHGSSAPACMKQDLILPYFAQTLEAHCCALCRFRQRKCTTALQKVPKACTMGCKETSITLTQGDARVGGSSMLKFCSARRSGSHRIGRLYRAAARSTMSRSCATKKSRAKLWDVQLMTQQTHSEHSTMHAWLSQHAQRPCAHQSRGRRLTCQNSDEGVLGTESLI